MKWVHPDPLQLIALAPHVLNPLSLSSLYRIHKSEAD